MPTRPGLCAPSAAMPQRRKTPQSAAEKITPQVGHDLIDTLQGRSRSLLLRPLVLQASRSDVARQLLFSRR